METWDLHADFMETVPQSSNVGFHSDLLDIAIACLPCPVPTEAPLLIADSFRATCPIGHGRIDQAQAVPACCSPFGGESELRQAVLDGWKLLERVS